jgi:hypothetical protein
MKKNAIRFETKTASRTVSLLAIAAMWLGFGSSAFGGVIYYSGVQNVLLEGVPGANRILSLDLAVDPGTWDNLQFSISTAGLGGGANDVWEGAPVSLASSAAAFPLVTRFDYGDPYPSNPVFGSGSLTLWGYGTGPADGDFYAAFQTGTSGGGPQYNGWIHLDVEKTDSSNPVVTVIDWAYSIGESISSIGQTLPSSVGNVVPEIDPNSAIGALALLCGALLLIRGRRARPVEWESR